MNIIVMEINIEHEGWQTLLRTTQKQPLQYMINTILNYDEYVQVRIGYLVGEEIYPLVQFDNKINRKAINLQDAYKIIEKNPKI